MKLEMELIEGTDHKICLVPYDYFPPTCNAHNLVRFDSQGDLVWAAALPPPDEWDGNVDAYVAYEIKEGRLFANSWSCYYVEIDINTGKILSSVFTK